MLTEKEYYHEHVIITKEKHSSSSLFYKLDTISVDKWTYSIEIKQGCFFAE